MVNGQRSLSFDDAILAEECLRLMTKPRPLDIGHQIQSIVGEIRREGEDTTSLARDMIRLYTTGHCGSTSR
jgi:hypothetical protein